MTDHCVSKCFCSVWSKNCLYILECLARTSTTACYAEVDGTVSQCQRLANTFNSNIVLFPWPLLCDISIYNGVDIDILQLL